MLERGKRWLCVSCSKEGIGEHPSYCQECGIVASWFVVIDNGNDNRSMTEIMLDRLMGYDGLDELQNQE